MKEAATNPEALQKLEDRVIKLKEDILQFNAAHAPAIAKDLHQQLTEKNKLLLDEVNQVLEKFLDYNRPKKGNSSNESVQRYFIT